MKTKKLKQDILDQLESKNGSDGPKKPKKTGTLLNSQNWAGKAFPLPLLVVRLKINILWPFLSESVARFLHLFVSLEAASRGIV